MTSYDLMSTALQKLSTTVCPMLDTHKSGSAELSTLPRFSRERETGLEPATPTLARSCSTN